MRDTGLQMSGSASRSRSASRWSHKHGVDARRSRRSVTGRFGNGSHPAAAMRPSKRPRPAGFPMPPPTPPPRPGPRPRWARRAGPGGVPGPCPSRRRRRLSSRATRPCAAGRVAGCLVGGRNSGMGSRITAAPAVHASVCQHSFPRARARSRPFHTARADDKDLVPGVAARGVPSATPQGRTCSLLARALTRRSTSAGDGSPLGDGRSASPRGDGRSASLRGDARSVSAPGRGASPLAEPAPEANPEAAAAASRRKRAIASASLGLASGGTAPRSGGTGDAGGGVSPCCAGGVRQPAPSSSGELAREYRLVPARLSEPIQSCSRGGGRGPGGSRREAWLCCSLGPRCWCR
jgi:hypothetical protein